MVNWVLARPILVVGLVQLALIAPPVLAQSGGAKKIICWKDKSGKVVGCGDSVPPEYQSSATKELDQRGVTRKTTESAEDAAKRQAREKELVEQKAAEEKRLAEQRRQDSALLNTYSNEQEIDAKRDRELKLIDQQIAEYQVSLKNAEARLSEARSRKGKEDAGAAADIDSLKKRIAAKEKDKEEMNQTYGAQKKRYQELRGTPQTAAAPTPTAAPVPAAKK